MQLWLNRTNLRYVLLALLFAGSTCYCAAGVFTNAMLTASRGDGHHRAAIIFEILTVLCAVVVVVFIVIAWKLRHRRDALRR